MADSPKDMAGKASEKLSSGKGKEAMEKLAGKADKATGGKFGKQIEKGQEKLRESAEKRKQAG
ncbi:MAG TPA: Rv0909 family putative TA system antitoxin [Micromonospora sp.]|nr:Rv0909 family putative TA system antitoxin [Micromonospora sp.]